jgi:hypothetical protein
MIPSCCIIYVAVFSLEGVVTKNGQQKNMAGSPHNGSAQRTPYILMVVLGVNEVAVAAATQHGISVREDQRLHHGLYWSPGREEYCARDLTDPRWQRTFLVTSATELLPVAAWLSETASQGLRPRADGALLYFHIQDAHGVGRRHHVLTAHEAADLEVEWQWIVENVEGCGWAA